MILIVDLIGDGFVGLKPGKLARGTRERHGKIRELLEHLKDEPVYF